MNNSKLRKLEAIFQKKIVESPPDGFKTRSQWAKEWEVSEQHCSRLIQRYASKDMLETRYFKVRSGMVTRPIPHYRIK